MVDKAGPDPNAEMTGVTLSVVDLSTAAHAVTGITDPELFAATQIDLNGANLGPATSDGYRSGNHPRIRPAN